MAPERATALMRRLSEEAPGIFLQALHAACAAMKARPVYLQRQPFEKRAEAIRRALSRIAANPVAEEVLAVYFLECRKELLTEWLDRLGLKHEDGTLEEDAPAAPARSSLRKAADGFRQADEDPDRELLLRAFAAQHAIDWPDLEKLLDAPA
jgi:hypothetical protein